MKRSDSILANFYYQKVPKLPKFQGDKKGSQVGGFFIPPMPTMPAPIQLIGNLVNAFSRKKEKPIKVPSDLEETIHLNLKDPRKVRMTTGKKMNPNRDLMSGDYVLNEMGEAIKRAKKRGLSLDDAWNMAAIDFQETLLGNRDDEMGHAKDYQGEDNIDRFLNAYQDKMKTADRLKYKDPYLRLQVYNGLGKVYPETEQWYHGFKANSFYGVPVPKTGLDLKRNPLYGKQIIDLRDNVLRKNPEFVKFINSAYGEGMKRNGGLVKYQTTGQVTIPGVTDFKMPRATSESTSAGVIDRRASANYAAQKGDEAERFIQNYQKQYPGATREQANFAFNASKKSVENQGQIKKAGPKRSAASKALAIATNPMTALEYKVKGQDIPENFEKGERNSLDMAVDVINPFSYAQAAKDVKSGVSDGNYTQAGLGLLNFIPGKFFGKAASKLDDLAGIKPKSVDVKPKIEFSKGPGVKTFDDVEDWGTRSTTAYDYMQDQLNALRSRGKQLDETLGETHGSELLNSDMIEYHGTHSGRPIVEVKMPNGHSEYFYKSTGWAGKEGIGANGTTGGQWQVYGQHMNAPAGTVTNSNIPNWFIKGPDYKTYYGSKGFGQKAEGLDNALMKKFDVTDVNQLDEYLNFQNKFAPADSYTPRPYKRGGMITDPRGQWAHPGQNTRIPGGNITMQGVPYPVLAKANNGMTTMMQPGQDYYFPGADYVDEYPMMKDGGLIKYQVGGDEPTGILKSFIKGNKIKGCKRGVNCGVGTLEGEGGKGEYVPLSNAPVTWEELQVYNETNPKSKEFKTYLKNLQSQFPGLTAQQLLAAGADSARVNQRKQDLKRYDQPAEQTYDRAYHMFYRPLMNQQGRVTIPQILQQQPGGFFNFEQNVRGNYGKKKGQMGLQVEEDFSVQDPNQERLDMGMRPNVPLDESLEAGSRDSDEFLRNWYAGRVDDPRYGEIASKRIEEIPNIQVKNMRPRFMRKGYAAYYPEGTKDIYLNPEHPFSRGSSTQAHEKKHLLYHQVPQQNQEDIIKQKLVDEEIWNERNPKKAAKKNWGYGYYSDPTEVAARLAEFRMRYNLDPRKKYTADDMKAIMDAHQRRGGKGLTKDEATSNTRSGDRSIDELYEMLGNDPVKLAELNDEIVMNQKAMGNNVAKYGGLAKYQTQGEVTYTHDPGSRGAYRVQTTVTPYTRNRDIKRFTQAPTDPRQVNFLQNYAGAVGGYQDDPEYIYPTQVPFEGEKHWNIDRFIIDPQFGNRTRANENAPDLEKDKNNVLADMYKYYLLQDPEHRGKAFRQAKRFVRKEINPRIKGPFLQAYNSKTSPAFGNFQGPQNFDQENRLKNLYWNEAIGEGAVTPDQINDLKNASLDFFRNYKNMSRRDAKDQWKKWEQQANLAKETGEYRHGGDISIPNLRQVYYPMAYGGPMVRYMAGKMTGPNIF